MANRASPYRVLSKKHLLLLKPFLDDLSGQVEQPEYIDHDPIRFMYDYSEKRDRELAGFFSAIMAWGRRDIVLAKVNDLLRRMNYDPYSFITGFSENDASLFFDFKHRTFKPIDIYWLIRTLQSILEEFPCFEDFWESCYNQANRDNRPLISVFHERFFSYHPAMPQRVRKHISDSDKNSSCKRLYMYLRWNIRKQSPVDTGLMDFMPESELMIPLDVHVARFARVLGLLSRHQNDWKSVVELTNRLRILDPADPTRYDFALFGLGALKLDLPDEYVVNRL